MELEFAAFFQVYSCVIMLSQVGLASEVDLFNSIQKFTNAFSGVIHYLFIQQSSASLSSGCRKRRLSATRRNRCPGLSRSSNWLCFNRLRLNQHRNHLPRT